MSDTLSKTLRIVLALLMAVSIGVTVWFFLATSKIESGLDADTQISLLGPALDSLMNWTIVLCFLAAGGTLLFAVWQIIANPKGAIRTLIQVGILAVVILISWALASDVPLHMPNYDGGGNEPGTLKFAGASLYAMYILFAGAFIAIVFSEVSKLFK